MKYKTVGLQGEVQAKDLQLEICKNTIDHRRKRYIDHARDPGKDNVIIIVRKLTTSCTNKYHDL